MGNIERLLASECIKHLGSEDEQKYFFRFFNYSKLMEETESPTHDDRLYCVMVDFYRWYFKDTSK
jgi:hypothetical protein